MSNIKKAGLLLVVLLLLAACGSKPEDQSSISPDSSEVGSGDDPQGDQTAVGDRQLFRETLAESELPPATQLAVGTIILDDTELAIGHDQAEILIPYWKLYLNLLESDATAPEELEAMINEIEGVMTSEQLSYIIDLELIQEDLMTLMSDLGINQGLRLDGEEGGDGFTRPDGLDGTRPGGGQGRGQGGGVDLDPELMATMEARREEMGGGPGANRWQVPVIEALIELLEGKIGN